jgi:hypothetical protein
MRKQNLSVYLEPKLFQGWRLYRGYSLGVQQAEVSKTEQAVHPGNLGQISWAIAFANYALTHVRLKVYLPTRNDGC